MRILIVLALLLVPLADPPPTEAARVCATDPTLAQVRVYGSDDFNHLDGYICADEYAEDRDFSDATGAFELEANNDAESMVIYGVPGTKTCVTVHQYRDLRGIDWTYSVVDRGPRNVNLRESFDNRASSIEVWRVAPETACR